MRFSRDYRPRRQVWSTAVTQKRSSSGTRKTHKNDNNDGQLSLSSFARCANKGRAAKGLSVAFNKACVELTMLKTRHVTTAKNRDEHPRESPSKRTRRSRQRQDETSRPERSKIEEDERQQGASRKMMKQVQMMVHIKPEKNFIQMSGEMIHWGFSEMVQVMKEDQAHGDAFGGGLARNVVPDLEQLKSSTEKRLMLGLTPQLLLTELSGGTVTPGMFSSGAEASVEELKYALYLADNPAHQNLWETRYRHRLPDRTRGASIVHFIPPPTPQYRMRDDDEEHIVSATTYPVMNFQKIRIKWSKLSSKSHTRIMDFWDQGNYRFEDDLEFDDFSFQSEGIPPPEQREDSLTQLGGEDSLTLLGEDTTLLDESTLLFGDEQSSGLIHNYTFEEGESSLEVTGPYEIKKVISGLMEAALVDRQDVNNNMVSAAWDEQGWSSLLNDSQNTEINHRTEAVSLMSKFDAIKRAQEEEEEAVKNKTFLRIPRKSDATSSDKTSIMVRMSSRPVRKTTTNKHTTHEELTSSGECVENTEAGIEHTTIVTPDVENETIEIFVDLGEKLESSFPQKTVLETSSANESKRSELDVIHPTIVQRRFGRLLQATVYNEEETQNDLQHAGRPEVRKVVQSLYPKKKETANDENDENMLSHREEEDRALLRERVARMLNETLSADEMEINENSLITGDDDQEKTESALALTIRRHKDDSSYLNHIRNKSSLISVFDEDQRNSRHQENRKTDADFESFLFHACCGNISGSNDVYTRRGASSVASKPLALE